MNKYGNLLRKQKLEKSQLKKLEFRITLSHVYVIKQYSEPETRTQDALSSWSSQDSMGGLVGWTE